MAFRGLTVKDLLHRIASEYRMDEVIMNLAYLIPDDWHILTVMVEIEAAIGKSARSDRVVVFGKRRFLIAVHLPPSAVEYYAPQMFFLVGLMHSCGNIVTIPSRLTCVKDWGHSNN